MALTEVTQLLIDGLHLYLKNTGEIILVCMWLQKEEQQIEMLLFLRDNKEATEQEVMDEARRIAGMK